MAAVLGGYLNGAEWPTDAAPLARAALIVAIVVALGNVVNDLSDVELDRIAKPLRPLPSEAVGLRSARVLTAALAVTVLVLSAGLQGPLMVFGLLCAVLGVVYSLGLKSTVLVGNVVVAALSAATLPFGGLVVGRIQRATVWATAMVFLFVLAREILKDVADHDGDLVMEIRTVSTVLGRAAALRLFAGTMTVFVIVALSPWMLGSARQGYVVAMSLLTVLPTVASTLLVHRAPSADNIERALRVTKVAWFNGLVAMTLLR